MILYYLIFCYRQGMLRFLLLSACLFMTSCGYSLQSSYNPLLVEDGVQTVYVQPVRNSTYKAGVENLVYNEVVRTISSRGRVKVVQQLSLADAVLNIDVVVAGYSSSASTTADQLFPSA